MIVIHSIIFFFICKSHPGPSYHYRYAGADCQKQSGMQHSRSSYTLLVSAVLYLVYKIREAVSVRTSEICGLNTWSKCIVRQSQGWHCSIILCQ